MQIWTNVETRIFKNWGGTYPRTQTPVALQVEQKQHLRD